MGKKVNIIGAGLAGLSAGIYLQKSGVETEIFELAGWAGGMCTAWIRSGYRFDGCIHWMVGTKPGEGFYSLYREVGALEEDTVIYNADHIKIEIDGVMYEIPLKIDEFKAFLNSLSQDDSIIIKEFCDDIETMINTAMPSGMPSNISDFAKIMKESRGFITLTRKYIGMTVEEFVRQFKSKTIQSILYILMPREFSMEALIMMLGTRMGGNAGYPIGGAFDMIKRMEAKYRMLGGKINFNSKVDEIVVDKGRATAIRSKGTLYPADAVIAACDAYDTLKNMLGGKYNHKQLDSMLESAPLFSPLMVVSFGVKKRFDIPYSLHMECPEGIKTAPELTQYSLSLRSFDFDQTAAPENCSSVMVMLAAPLDYWNNLRRSDITEYKKHKEQVADEVADAIDKRFPGFKEAIEIIDVATPATYARLANLYKASFEGFLPIPASLKTSIRKTIPGLKNAVICGQWTTAGGGICSAIDSGKDAAHLILKEIKK